ncbi:MAG: transketolase [Christensenellales bacterium]|jgi:transketolase
MQDLKQISKEIRKWTLEMIANLGGGHVGGSLSIVDILTVLYFEKMNIDPQNPKMEDRDRFVLSKGHAGPGLYATLARRGYFDRSWLDTLNGPHTLLPSHVDMTRTPGVDQTAGSLGQGISCAVGHAIAGKLKGKDYKVYCIVGDGELNEGSCWEAFMLASTKKLDNLVVMIDANKWQIDGRTCDVINLDPLPDKFTAFGFEVFEADGHDIGAISQAIDKANAVKDKPICIIFHTIKGKGFKPLEDQRAVHHTPVSAEDLAASLEYIDTL